jgi:ferrous iron transport protein B
LAKETVVSTLSVLFAGEAALAAALTPAAALAFLVFCLLYTPCVAAIAAIKRELGAGWALRVAVGMFAMAWLAALAVRLIGMALGMA